MANIDLNHYREEHPHRLKRILWGVLNLTLFPLFPWRLRNLLLNAFGAKIGRSLVYRSARIYAPWNLSIGDYSCIGPRVDIYCKSKVSIGSHAVISQDAYLCTASHDVASRTMAMVMRPIEIADSVWVAARAVVLPGVCLGEGAVVGCAAVVTKDVEPWTVVGGNPAQFLKKRVIEERVK